MFGYKSIWDMRSGQIHWVVRHLGEEFKPVDKKEEQEGTKKNGRFGKEN